MSLFSAMMASVSGMQGQANLLSTISDNIANSGTTGYKEATASFQDMLSQVSTTSYTAGGVATTIGYNISSQGEFTSSTSPTNIAISGNGFYVVQDAGGNTYLTRAGDFSANVNGQLVNSEGYTLMGYPLTALTTNSPPGSVGQLTPITISNAGLVANPSTSGTLTANLNSASAIDTGTLPAANTAASTYTDMTSVTAYDNLGTPVTLNVYFTKTASNTWEMDVFNAANAAPGGGFPYSSGPLTTQSLSFSASTGDLTTGSPVSFTVPNGQSLSLNLSSMTQLASTFAVSANTINGNAPASYTGVSIGSNGTISEVYSDGTTKAVAKIPLATVASVNNLTPHAGQAYSANPESGNIILGSANTEGFGSIKSDSLESSTVDLATQLTEMVVSQNAYSANSKAFQTGSDMLTTLIQMLK